MGAGLFLFILMKSIFIRLIREAENLSGYSNGGRMSFSVTLITLMEALNLTEVTEVGFTFTIFSPLSTYW